MFQKYAIIENGKITNIVVASEQVAQANSWVSVEGIECDIGWEYDGQVFTAPQIVYDLPLPEYKARKIKKIEADTRTFLDNHYDLRDTDVLMLLMMMAQQAGNTQAVQYISQAFLWGMSVKQENVEAIAAVNAAQTHAEVDAIDMPWADLEASDPKVSVANVSL